MLRQVIASLVFYLLLPSELHSAGLASDTLSTVGLKRMTLEELMDIDITLVSKRPESWFESPASVHVIGGEEIRRSGASSIPEALRLANNLQVAQKGPAAWGISARGFNTELANKLLVLMDGRTVYTPLYSGVFWDRQDYLLKDIDRIEVVNGPGGTIWGANAVNGVINIISKNAEETQGVHMEAGGGTELWGFAGLRFGSVLGSDSYYRIYGKYIDRGKGVLANGTKPSDSWLMGQGGFRIDVNHSPENDFTVQGDFYSSDAKRTTGGIARTRGANLLGRWRHTFSAVSDINLQLYYDRTELALPTPAFAPGGTMVAPAGTLRDYLDTYDLDFQHRIDLGEHNILVWGLGYRFTHDVVKNSPGLGFFPERLDQRLYSAFVQDEILLLDNLYLTVGTKVGHNAYTGIEFEPAARVRFNLTETQTLWAAASRAVRIPSRVDRDESLPTPPYYILPSPPFPALLLLIGGRNFKSESVVSYEVGYRVRIGGVVGSLSTFYNVYDNIRSTSLSPPDPVFGLPFPLFYENHLKGETYGLELNVAYQLSAWWRLKGAYNLLKEDVRIKTGQMDFNNAMNETSDPGHQCSFQSAMDLFEHVELDIGLRWVDVLYNNDGPQRGSVPSYFELDIRVGWSATEAFEISLVGQNLLHNHHPEYGYPFTTRVEVERSMYGRLALTI